MTMILFLQTSFGLVFVLRTFKILANRGLIDANALTKIGTATAAAVIVIPFWFRASPAVVIAAQGAIVGAALGIFARLESLRRARIRSEFARILDRWILNIRCGVGIKSALDKALLDSDAATRRVLEPWLAGDPAAAGHELIDGRWPRRVSEIRSAATGALAQLESFRDQIRRASEFRRKSGQAVLQARVQLVGVMALMIALTFFTMCRFGWAMVGDLVAISWLMVAAGSFVFHHVTRKRGWKL